jgi:AsmA-like C-terminal region
MDDMNKHVGPLVLISFLAVLVSALVVGIWAVTLPGRVVAQLKDEAQARGVEFSSGGASLGYDDGIGVVLDSITITSANSGIAGTIKALTVQGLMPWNARSVMLDGADFTHVVPVNAEVASASKTGVEANTGNGLDQIHIANGRFRIVDLSGALLLDVAEATGNISAQEKDAALFSGRGRINGRHTTWRVEVESLTRLDAGGSPADVFIAATDVSKPFDLQFSGRLQLAQGFSLDGRFSSAASDARSFLTFLGLPDLVPVEGALAAEGGLSFSSSALKLSDLSLTQGDKDGKGRLAISFAPDGYSVDGAIDLPVLRLPSPKTMNFWSERPLVLPDFSKLTGTFDIRARELVIDTFHTDAPRLALRFESTGPSATLTAGQNRDQLTVTLRNTAQQAKPGFSLSAQIALQNAAPFIEAVTGQPLLGGGLTAKADIGAEGQNLATLLSTAKGSIEVKARQADISGYALHDLLSVPGSGWRAAPGDKTEGIEADIVASVSDGIAVLKVVSAKADGTSHAITGEVDLLRRSLALDVTPRGGKRVGISGPWSEPVFGPDVEGAPEALPVAAKTPLAGD